MKTSGMSFEFTLRAIVYPAPDLKNQWIAHCLDTDQMAQGDSAKEAASLLLEAMNDVVRFRVERRMSPVFVLRPAPQEVWDLVAAARPFKIHGRVSIEPRIESRRRKARRSGWFVQACISKSPPSQAHAG